MRATSAQICDLYAAGITPENMLHTDIASADERHGGKLTARFRTMHPTIRSAIAARR